MSLGTNHTKKQIILRLPVTLLAKIDAMAIKFELSREGTVRLMLAGADETTLIRGFARLTEEDPRCPRLAAARAERGCARGNIIGGGGTS
ncbi:MAG: hypothetical protein ACRERE_42655 [Candidatus Entotheonellia bacterium]